jgi:membrane protein CcdC involved in cytochrome C biogenesis
VSTLEYVTPQLPTLAPMLLVYLIGVVLSLLHFKRIAKPAAFALVGFDMLFLNNSMFPFVHGYFAVSEWPLQEKALCMGVVVIIRTLLQVTAFSLLIVAIFVDRSAPAGPE